MDLSPRPRVPDLELVADQLLSDLNVRDDETGGEAQAKLDARSGRSRDWTRTT